MVPGLVALRAPRMAWVAPKLIRRVKGVTGGARPPSSSSTAFSSIESELVERLPRRRRADGVVGDVPERPSVVTESRRRGSLTAVEARGVGKGAAEGCETELLRKRLVKALEVMDPRRCRAMSFALLFPLSEDIVKERIERSGKMGRLISEPSEFSTQCRPQGWPVAEREWLRENRRRAECMGRASESYVLQMEVVRVGCAGAFGGGGGETLKWAVGWGSNDDGVV